MSAILDPEPIRVPADEAFAVYANDFEVWTTEFDTTLDFFVLGPLAGGERPAEPVVRVRLPVGMLLPVSTALVNAIYAHERRVRGDA